jgi:hypothetical protein
MKPSQLIMLSLVFLAACRPTQSGDPVPVIRPQPGKELCPQACESMKNRLMNDKGAKGCEEAAPTPAAQGQGDVACADGGEPKGCVSCVTFCIYQHENGTFWNNDCIINKITKCSEIETVCNTQK